MQGSTVTQDLARGIARVIYGKGYARLVAGKRTLAYANDRKGGLQLDFRAADVGDAPARLRKRATVNGDRALVTVTPKNAAGARALLEHVARKAGQA